jgi:hypothetical protein
VTFSAAQERDMRRIQVRFSVEDAADVIARGDVDAVVSKITERAARWLLFWK